MEVLDTSVTEEFIDVAIRLNGEAGLLSNSIIKTLETKKCKILKSYFILEDEDKNGNKVSPHYHGYVRFTGVSMPTFRTYFKAKVLKLLEYTKHKRGNSLYSISVLRDGMVRYISYMVKNLDLTSLDVDEFTGLWQMEHPYASFGFTQDEKNAIYNKWFEMKNSKEDFKNSKKKLSTLLGNLEKEFFSSSPGYFIFNHNSRTHPSQKSLVKEYLQCYLEVGATWRIHTIKSKCVMWWLKKYPEKLDSYIAFNFPNINL